MAIRFPTMGGKTPETKLSMRELVDKMHNVMGYINSLVGKHAAVTDPLQRAQIEVQIRVKLFDLQNFTAKFGKAFLDRANRNSLYINKLISSMDVRTLFSRYQNPIRALENFGKISNDNMDEFSNEARDDMEKWYGLRRYSGEVKSKVKSNIGTAIRAIGKKVEAIQEQQEKEKKKLELAAKKQEEQPQYSKQHEEEKRRKLELLKRKGFLSPAREQVRR